MKYLNLILVLLLISCSSNSLNENDKEEFASTVQLYQNIYNEADADNCGKLLKMVDENIEFTENGETWTKEDMEQYCPHLSKKDVFETISNQKLLTPDLAYDFVNQLYPAENQDTLSETSSRIWKKYEGNWKIIKMDIVRDRVVN